jgi:hypothetical protein
MIIYLPSGSPIQQRVESRDAAHPSARWRGPGLSVCSQGEPARVTDPTSPARRKVAARVASNLRPPGDQGKSRCANVRSAGHERRRSRITTAQARRMLRRSDALTVRFVFTFTARSRRIPWRFARAAGGEHAGSRAVFVASACAADDVALW